MKISKPRKNQRRMRHSDRLWILVTLIATALCITRLGYLLYRLMTRAELENLNRSKMSRFGVESQAEKENDPHTSTVNDQNLKSSVEQAMVTRKNIQSTDLSMSIIGRNIRAENANDAIKDKGDGNSNRFVDEAMIPRNIIESTDFSECRIGAQIQVEKVNQIERSMKHNEKKKTIFEDTKGIDSLTQSINFNQSRIGVDIQAQIANESKLRTRNEEISNNIVNNAMLKKNMPLKSDSRMKNSESLNHFAKPSETLVLPNSLESDQDFETLSTELLRLAAGDQRGIKCTDLILLSELALALPNPVCLGEFKIDKIYEFPDLTEWLKKNPKISELILDSLVVFKNLLSAPDHKGIDKLKILKIIPHHTDDFTPANAVIDRFFQDQDCLSYLKFVELLQTGFFLEERKFFYSMPLVNGKISRDIIEKVLTWVEYDRFGIFFPSHFVDLLNLMTHIAKYFELFGILHNYSLNFIDNGIDDWKKYIANCMYKQCSSENNLEKEHLMTFFNIEFECDEPATISGRNEFLLKHTEDAYKKFLEKINRVNQKK